MKYTPPTVSIRLAPYKIRSTTNRCYDSAYPTPNPQIWSEEIQCSSEARISRFIPAYSYDEVVDWLFETHGLVVGMEPCDPKKWAGFVRVSGMSLDNVLDGFSFYPDESRYLALDEAIISAIELIETDEN